MGDLGVRQGTEIRLYVNGELMGTGVIGTGSMTPVDLPVTIGAAADGTNPYTGVIGNVRITKGVHRYCGPFTLKVYSEADAREPYANELALADRDAYYNAMSSSPPTTPRALVSVAS